MLNSYGCYDPIASIEIPTGQSAAFLHTFFDQNSHFFLAPTPANWPTPVNLHNALQAGHYAGHDMWPQAATRRARSCPGVRGHEIKRMGYTTEFLLSAKVCVDAQGCLYIALADLNSRLRGTFSATLALPNHTLR